ncbi:MAG TPA: hypothetical protein VK530_04525 [Candidatus Acidoferrum sp.]|nr:hypothetical protein [Candidatus Acidoferrum sp.]
MKHIFGFLAACLFALSAYAQTTNGPRTYLEALETRTNTMIIKGSTEIGVIHGSAGGVLVAAKESTDASTGQKVFGVSIVVRGREKTQDTSYVDYEELDSMIKALGLMNTPPWSDTSMPQVEVSYTTKDGLRIASANARNNAGMESLVQSTHACQATACLNVAQLITLRGFIEQAKGKLEGIRPKSAQ